ncbi:hypothetical protein Pcinc_032977, partial [Petrolisthes cinctipes]
ETETTTTTTSPVEKVDLVRPPDDHQGSGHGLDDPQHDPHDSHDDSQPNNNNNNNNNKEDDPHDDSQPNNNITHNDHQHHDPPPPPTTTTRDDDPLHDPIRDNDHLHDPTTTTTTRDNDPLHDPTTTTNTRDDDPLHDPPKTTTRRPHKPGSVSMVIHKCCPEEQVWDHTTESCQHSRDLTFSVPIFTIDYYGMYMESNLTRDQVALWTDMLGCQKYLLDVVPENKPEFDFRVLDTGQLWVPEYERHYDPPHYCLENFVRDASLRGSPHIQGAMVCILETEVETFDPSKVPVRKCCMYDEVRGVREERQKKAGQGRTEKGQGKEGQKRVEQDKEGQIKGRTRKDRKRVEQDEGRKDRKRAEQDKGRTGQKKAGQGSTEKGQDKEGQKRVYDATSSCALRENVTSDPWLVPLRSLEGPLADVRMVDIRQPPYSDTHELVPNFQTCVGEQMGWQVELFQVESETGGLYLPLLDRVIPYNQYCIEDFHTNGSLVPMAYVCVSEDEMEQLHRLQTPGCQTDSCVPKCCPLGEVISAASHRCVPAQEISTASHRCDSAQENSTESHRCIQAQEYLFTPTIRHLNGSHSDILEADYQFGFPDCAIQLTYPHEEVELQEGGSLRYRTNNTDECQPHQVYNIPRGSYCIDQVYYASGEVKQGAGFCFQDHWDHLVGVEKQEVNYLYSAFLAISDLFILISFVVYLTVPDHNKRGLNKNIKLAHSVLGRILLCFLFSLFFAYLFLIIIKLFSDPINLASPSACIGVGVCMYMFFMATFFWLNVLCFELWWKCARQERSSGRRWVWYQVYAWVCPLVFGGISLIMEFSPNISNCYIKPKFGTYSCFFSYSVSHNNGAKWAYFLGPVAVLLLADLVFFLMTVRSLLVTVQQSHKGTVQRQGRQRLRLCFKLFLVMGISWLAEIISFQLGPSTVWYISDVFNCFQGFIIFLIFILKPKILETMKVRVCTWCGSPPPSRPRGTNVFSSVMLSNSASTDEFSLSNQLSFAAHSRLSSSSRSQSPRSLSRFPHLPHKDLALSLSRQSNPHAQLDSRTSSSNTFGTQSRPQVDSGPPTAPGSASSSSPASSRPSTPRTTSTRASLSTLSVVEASC